jgi:hypothetical protein
MRALAALSLAAAGVTGIAAPLDAFKDPEDGQFDASEWLLDRKGFLPVPIVITEPAVGYGGGIAAVFFRDSMRDSASRKGPSGETIPPDILGVAAAATSNGTKFGGLGGIASFDDDHWRYRGGAARMSANLDFYGIGGVLGGDGHKIGYNLDGWGSMQQVLYRLGSSNAWLTGRWFYLDTKQSLHTDIQQRRDRRRAAGRHRDDDVRAQHLEVLRRVQAHRGRRRERTEGARVAGAAEVVTRRSAWVTRARRKRGSTRPARLPAC